MADNVLKELKPFKVFNYFEELTTIPRQSRNEKMVSDYLVDFARKRNLEVIQDTNLNVIIKKKASKGYEDRPTIIIQGHMDMVCEKNADVKHDFSKDPLKLRIIDDFIYATGTSLGADNGIAVAIGMAILDSDDINHPAIEFVATTVEESGMDGAIGLNCNNIKGRHLINLDSEEEGKLYVGCSGEITAKISIPIIWEKSDKSLIPCTIKIRDLKGGHSGIEIDKERANSNKLMGRILMDLDSSIDFNICSINGGLKQNAIPRETDTVILIKPSDKTKVTKKILAWEKIFQNEFKYSDPDLKIYSEALDTTPDNVFCEETQSKVISFLYLCPNGINSMSMDMEGLVESSQNLGIVTTDRNKVKFVASLRSFIKTLKLELFNRICVISKLVGAEVKLEFAYPEWEYNPDSKMKEIFEEVYTKLYGKSPEITMLHAGLECGVFTEKFRNMDIISFGPNLYDVHTPNEHISISSVIRTWNLLLELLKNIS